MRRGWTTKLWVESWLAAASALLGLVTLINAEWIELVVGVDPDGGSGALEWAIAAGLLLVAVVSAVLARLEWRQLRLGGAPVTGR
jgi:hypothetical protein